MINSVQIYMKKLPFPKALNEMPIFLFLWVNNIQDKTFKPET